MEKISIELTPRQAALLQLAISDALVKNRDERDKFTFDFSFRGAVPLSAYNYYDQRINEYLDVLYKIAFAKLEEAVTDHMSKEEI